MPITFQNADIGFSLKQKKGLKDFIASQLKTEGINRFALSYVFCSDDYLLDINRRFLGHDYYTDVITFPISEDDAMLEAEIYISIERVKDNAKLLKLGSKRSPLKSQDVDNEMYRVIFHSVLHLLGHQDKTKPQKDMMRSLEDKWLKKFGILLNVPHGTI
jgi:probable rRNA maturation factor